MTKGESLTLGRREFVVYGAGPQTAQLLAELRYFGLRQPIAITVDAQYKDSDEAYGFPLVEFEEACRSFPPDAFDMAVVEYGVPRNLRKMFGHAKVAGYTMPNYISPGAFVDSDVVMGEGNFVFRGCDLGYGGRMGSGNTIRQKTYLGHQFDIGDFNAMAPGCTIGGMCVMGDLCWIGLGATVRNCTTLGDESLVGMGAVVTKDVEPRVTVMGVPAREVARHEDGVDLRQQRQGRVH